MKKKKKISRKPTSAYVRFSLEQLVSLSVAVNLRIEALEENNDPDEFGWKIIHRKIQKAIRDLNS